MVFLKNNFLKIFRTSNSILNTKVRNQLFASLVVNIVIFSHGITLGWAAPTLLQLTSDESPLDFKITLSEASWIASLVGLGSLLGNLGLCNLIDILGRKPCLLIMALPNICLWILIYAASSVEYLLVARFIGGITGGASFSIVPLFINEIADVVQRGAFQAFFAIAFNLGVLVGYILSSTLSYHLVPCIAVVLPLIFVLLLLYFPETPHHLIRKGRDDSALKSIQFYKNYEAVTGKCEQEFRDLKATIMNNKAENKVVFRDFITKSALKAYGIILVLLIMNQSSGVYALITYMTDVFTMSGAPLDPNTCTIIMGIVQLVGNFTTIFFVDRCGRKILIIISSVGVILGLTAFGCFTYLKEFMDLAAYTWVPLVLMIFILFLGNIGLVSVTIISVVEILPVKIRSTAFSFCLAILSLLVFAIIKVFPVSMHSFGISITFWFCAGVSAVCLLFVIVFLTETKGKVMEID